MISLEAVSFSYGDGPGIFQDFSWRSERGMAWAVLGPSGCGKTTLLYLLAGLQFPSRGKVFVDGQPVTRPRPQTGLILQEYGLLPWATIRQNVSLGLQVRAFYGPDGRHAPAQQIDPTDVESWLTGSDWPSMPKNTPGSFPAGSASVRPSPAR